VHDALDSKAKDKRKNFEVTYKGPLDTALGDLRMRAIRALIHTDATSTASEVPVPVAPDVH